MEHPSLRPETLRRISEDPDLAERYRQAVVNHQVAGLLDVRALSDQTPGQAEMWRRRASERRALGDQLVQRVLDQLARGSRGSKPRPAQAAPSG